MINAKTFYERMIQQLRKEVLASGKIDEIADNVTGRKKKKGVDPSNIRKALKLDTSSKEGPHKLSCLRFLELCHEIKVHPVIFCLEEDVDRQVWSDYCALDPDEKLDVSRFIWRIRGARQKERVK